MFSYQFFIREYQEEVVGNQLSSLLMVQNAFETMLVQLDNLANQISMEDDLTGVTLETDISIRMRFRSRLTRYQLSSGYLRDILYYKRDGHTLYGASSTYSLKNYAAVVNPMSGLTQQEFEELMNNTSVRTLLPPQAETPMGLQAADVVNMLYPLPYLSTDPNTTVLFKIDAHTIYKLFGTPDQAQSYAIALAQENGHALLCSNPWDSGELQAVLEQVLALDKQQGSYQDRLNGTDFFISFQKNSEKGITYLYRTPAQVALHKVERLRILFLAIFFALILLEFVIVFAVGYRNYLPMRALREFITANFSSMGSQEEEIQAVRRILTELSITHQKLNERLELGAATLREVILYKLINGGFANLEELNELKQQSKIEITKSCLFVVIYQPSEEGADSPHIKRIMDIFSRNLEECQLYGCSFSQQQVFVIASDLSSPVELKRQFAFIREEIRSCSSAAFSLGVGGMCYAVSKLHYSFIQANTAIDYRLVSGYNNVIFYSDILSDKELFQFYPETEINALRDSILANNREQLVYLIQEIVQVLKNHRSNLILAKLVSYDAVNIMTKVLLEVEHGYADITRKAPDIMFMASTSSVDQLIAVMEEVGADCCQRLIPRDKSNRMMEEVLTAIHKNYDRYDFTVSQLADQFHLSQNNLSQQFKRYTNQTPSDLINYLKIEKAKQYLADTDMPIRLIVERLGYTNESSFIRKFRGTVGMTPGEYRKKKTIYGPSTGGGDSHEKL